MENKVVISVFDEKIGARLERERKQTIRGLWTLRTREKFDEETEKLRRLHEKQQHGDGKLEIDEEQIEMAEKSKEIEIAERSCYKFTKISKIKMFRARKEKERFEAFFNHYKKWKFLISITKLKKTFLAHEWHRTCHLKERTMIRENARLEKMLRIRWEFNIDEIVPPDSIVFDKIVKYKRDRKKQAQLRRQRMIEIIQKITKEMTNGIRVMRKPYITDSRKVRRSITSILDEYGEESSGEISIEKIENYEEFKIQSQHYEENLIALTEKEDRKTKDKQIVDKSVKQKGERSLLKEKAKLENEIEEKKQEKEKVSLNGENDVNKSVLIQAVSQDSKSSIEEIYPLDNCFFSNPSTVVFEDFEINKKYSRKVSIINKTPKWAYLRFNKVFVDVWEPGIIEVDIIDAARVKPGLNITINVNFSPVNDEKVTGDISFLTLKPEDTKTFHEFRIRVVCEPKNPVPVLNPMELKFPTAPIWSFTNPKYSERILTISNDGEKSFSFSLGQRDHKEDCFVWHFDEGDAQSVKSSISCTSENESYGNDEIEAIDTPRRNYQIAVPNGVQCRLRITFRPRFLGLHHEVLKIWFFCDARNFDKQDIPMWAEVTGSQIYLDPPCIDLGIAVVDTDVCQQSFKIVNTGRSSLTVVTKTPKRLGSRVIVHPRSTILQPESFYVASVRLIPAADFLHLSERFYDQTSSILEFPIQVQVLTQETEKPPPLILKVIANLISCHSLILEPETIDLGLVYTHESVHTELTLTNDSLITQEFAFSNFHPFMEIQPNDGFGVIFAGETIKLDLIYSACPTDIRGNEIGANGLAGERRFEVKVVTLAQLAGNKNRKELRELKHLYDKQTKIPQNRGTPPEISLHPRINDTVSDSNEDEDESNQLVDSQFLADEEDTGTEEIETSVKSSHQPRRRKKTNTITVLVDIVDTLCEMSEQIIEFPATPCGSFSIVSVDLRGFNTASYPNCTCELLKNQDKVFTAHYELKCSSDHVQVIPQRGFLHNKEFVKIHFIFKPTLATNAILEESQKLKMEAKEREKENREKTEEVDKKSKKGRAKQSKSPKKKTGDKEEIVSEMDKLAGEISLLDTFEPNISTIFATCAIELETKNGSGTKEQLFVKLICPVTKPGILILNEERDMDFGSTAIGIIARKVLLVKNISNNNVKVDVSILNPFGPFFVAPGKTIETGTILKIPVTYRPIKDGETEELLEVSEFKTGTRWQVRTSGRGVVPSYVLRPQFKVAYFEITDDKPVDLKISITNTGNCPLIFSLKVIDVLEGEIPATQENPGEKSNIKKKRGSVGSGSRKKSPKRPEFRDDLQPQEESIIFGGGLKESINRDCFSFTKLDEDMLISIQEGKKTDFSIIFHSTPKENSSSDKKKSPKQKKKKKAQKEKQKGGKKSNYWHVAVLKLFLGSSTPIQDIIMICSIK